MSHSDRLYEDPSQKEARMWKLQEKVYKDNGYSFSPNLMANYKPSNMIELGLPSNEDEEVP